MNYAPPKNAVNFLRWFCREDCLEEIEGNIIELYEKQCLQDINRANRSFYKNVILHFRPEYIKPLSTLLKRIQMNMLKNYFRIATRSISKSKAFTAIHVLGLGIGVAACLLIFQYVHFEQSYDRFHENADNIYRVPIQYSEGFSSWPKTAANHPGTGPAMKRDFPEVEAFTRFVHPSSFGANLSFSYESLGQKKVYNEDQIYLADSTFFTIFSFPFIAGDRVSALNKPASLVLTASMAHKYFGDENPIGKVLHLNGDREMTVTGVVENIPDNSHLDFEAVFSFNTFFGNISESNLWIWPEFYTYVQLIPGINPERVESRFPAFTEKYMAAIHKEHDFQTYFSLQPLLDIHLKSECANEPTTPGSQRMVYFLTLLGMFILIIAWVNYINLSTSKSLERAKEVGVRKVIGANRLQLIGQFLIESTLLNGMGILLGLIIARIFLNNFTQLVGKDIGNSFLNTGLITQPFFWIFFVGSILLGGLISGFYPALVLSSFKPVQALRGRYIKSKNSISFKKLLVGFQFVLSILLISATLLVTKQLAFMNKKELGYSKDQVLVVKAPILTDSMSVIKSQVLMTKMRELPMVSSLTRSSEIPGKLIAFRSETRKFGQEKDYNVATFLQKIDDQFISTYNIPIVAGRNFVQTDSSLIFNADNNKVLVNEKLASTYGYQRPEDVIGESIKFKLGPIDHDAEVIGVVKNYHQRSLKEAYDPILYYYPSYDNWAYYSLNVSTSDWGEAVAILQEKYKEVFAENYFEYFFLDEFFDRQYRAEQKFGSVCKLFAGFAIFVACLGFFGLSALILIQRTKEIGIRKILGSRLSGILLLLTKDFIIMLVIANLIALPVILYFGNQWLNNFAFNDGFGWQVFVLPILLLLLIVFIIVGGQIYRTAVLNPIHAIRNE